MKDRIVDDGTINRFHKHAKILQDIFACWLWLGAKSHGYAAFYAEGRVQYAHQISFRIFTGVIPNGLDVLHTCNTKLCINPNHLYLGTDTENGADRVRDGISVKGSKAGQAKLTDDLVKYVRYSCKSHSELSRELNVGISTIWSVRNGISWTHI